MLITSAILFVGGIATVVGCIALFLWADGSYRHDWLCVPVILVGVFAAIAVCAGIIIPISVYGERAYGRVECRNWGHQTNRPTRFVALTSWDGGQCLTRDDHGKWISKDQVRVFGSAS